MLINIIILISVSIISNTFIPPSFQTGFTENEGFMQTYKLFPNIFNFERPVNLSLEDAEDILMDAVGLFPENAKHYMRDMYFGTIQTILLSQWYVFNAVELFQMIEINQRC